MNKQVYRILEITKTKEKNCKIKKAQHNYYVIIHPVFGTVTQQKSDENRNRK